MNDQAIAERGVADSSANIQPDSDDEDSGHQPSNAIDYNSDSGEESQRATAWKCKDCSALFEKKSQLDTHRKKTHQQTVTTSNTLGEEIKLTRGKNDEFVCPNDWCAYSTKDSGYIRRHMWNCDGPVKKSRSHLPAPVFAGLAPHGEDIQGVYLQ